MDKIDLGMAFDAYDDFDEIFGHFKVIMEATGNDSSKTIENLNRRLNELAKVLPVKMFVANKVYGEMEEVAFRKLKATDLVTDKGQLAGPPYYYLHIEASEDVARAINGLEESLGSVFE